MKNRTLLFTAIVFALVVAPAMAMQGHDSSGTTGGHDMASDDKMDHDAHGAAMDDTHTGGTFKHHDSMDGIDADFQVMSLASMNMTSDTGETHHIMVDLSRTDDGAPIKDAVGKIKVVGPDGAEQISPLKNYNGILAANFTFAQPGKYGVICLLKYDEEKSVFKFWYHHM